MLDRAKQFALLPEMEQNTQTQMRADKREDSEWSLHEQGKRCVYRFEVFTLIA